MNMVRTLEMKKPTAARRGLDRRNGVQSIEVGSQLLDALAGSAGPLYLGALASAAGMSASKARRYLVSLLRCGLVEQDNTTGRYDLGKMALRIGLTTLNRQDGIRIATAALIDLNQEMDRTVLLSIWSERGPIIIAWYDSTETLICNLNVGSILPILRSVSGRVFLSYLPRGTTQLLLSNELKNEFVQSKLRIRTDKDAGRLIREIQRAGLSHTEELLVPGLSALGAPIFDHQGRILAVMGMVGLPGRLRAKGPGSDGEVLLRKTQEVSRRLGFKSEGIGGSLAEWLDTEDLVAPRGDPPALALPLPVSKILPIPKQARSKR